MEEASEAGLQVTHSGYTVSGAVEELNPGRPTLSLCPEHMVYCLGHAGAILCVQIPRWQD